MTNANSVTLYLIRHGQTEWALSGQHTGKSDIPLTDEGRAQSARLRVPLSQMKFTTVLVSPRSRAQETAKLAGFAEQATVCDDLAELDYGDYEGLTSSQIREKVPDWTVWTHTCPNGETIEQAAQRCRNVIETAATAGGTVLLFAHGHILRILTATWLQLPPNQGKCFMLDTGTISCLSHEHDSPAIKLWNSQLG